MWGKNWRRNGFKPVASTRPACSQSYKFAYVMTIYGKSMLKWHFFEWNEFNWNHYLNRVSPWRIKSCFKGLSRKLKDGKINYFLRNLQRLKSHIRKIFRHLDLNCELKLFAIITFAVENLLNNLSLALMTSQNKWDTPFSQNTSI